MDDIDRAERASKKPRPRYGLPTVTTPRTVGGHSRPSVVSSLRQTVLAGVSDKSARAVFKIIFDAMAAMEREHRKAIERGEKVLDAQARELVRLQAEERWKQVEFDAQQARRQELADAIYRLRDDIQKRPIILRKVIADEKNARANVERWEKKVQDYTSGRVKAVDPLDPAECKHRLGKAQQKLRDAEHAAALYPDLASPAAIGELRQELQGHLKRQQFLEVAAPPILPTQQALRDGLNQYVGAHFPNDPAPAARRQQIVKEALNELSPFAPTDAADVQDSGRQGGTAAHGFAGGTPNRQKVFSRPTRFDEEARSAPASDAPTSAGVKIDAIDWRKHRFPPRPTPSASSADHATPHPTPPTPKPKGPRPPRWFK